MKGIYQVVGSDGVVLTAIAAETEEQARAAMAEFEAADLLYVNDTTLDHGELYELGNDEVGSLIIIAVADEAEARATADGMGELFEEHYDIRHVATF
ncbi:hypothetical protein [Salmonella phage PMBT28]|nr:hypothetical protein [Salmonella phage PMBT28]